MDLLSQWNVSHIHSTVDWCEFVLSTNLGWSPQVVEAKTLLARCEEYLDEVVDEVNAQLEYLDECEAFRIAYLEHDDPDVPF